MTRERMDIPTTEPTKIRAGDTWQWRREDLSSDYPASTWTLKYYLKNASNHIEITASADGDYFAVTVTAATTIAYTAGTYSWVAYAEKGAGASLERYELDRGILEVLRSFVDVNTYDARSHAKIALDSLNEALKTYGNKAYTLNYSIAGRVMQFKSNDEFMKMRSLLKTEVQREEAAEKISQGLDSGRRIGVRFNRV